MQKHFNDRMLYVIQATAPKTGTGLYLLRRKTNERFAIDKPTVMIGKDRARADLWIADNNAVSRVHASILLRDGTCFVIDHGSTNHTYVDGSMIASDTEVLVALGAVIRLGNEEFILTE